MADNSSKIDTAAEKAFAEAAERKTAEATSAKSGGSSQTDGAKVAVTEPARKSAAEPEALAKAAPVRTSAARKASARKPVVARKALRKKSPKKSAQTKIPPVTKLKESIMATAKTAQTTDFAKSAKDMAADLQTRAKSAYDKGAALTAEATEFQKGNFEALVESGKIFAAGMQNMGRTYVEEAKSAVETVQDDVKKIAAVKSPTELFQLQGEIARRNFDAVIATASKNAEAMLKLANEAFAPMSSRMSLAAEKVSKTA